jgi:hypothetical protein
MNNVSGLDRGFGLSAAMLMPPMLLDDLPPSVTQPVALDLQPHELGFRRLRGPREISRIVHLREEIRLSSAVLADASFALREKKETKSAWWAHSCAVATR